MQWAGVKARIGPDCPAISTNWVVEPTAIKIGAEDYIYFDHCGNPQYYGAIKSTDMKTWQDVSPTVPFPKGIRYGTVLAATASVVHAISTDPKQLKT